MKELPILEKIAQSSRARHWTDSIPLEYHYTVGVAGEEFRRELKEKGRFLASKCLKCNKSYVPARMYCPTCFVETKERVTLDRSGYVYSYTVVARDRAGRRIQPPMTVVLVKFEGVEGGFVHKLEVDAVRKVELGMKLEPILKPFAERTGALTDILGFKPLG